MNGNLRDGLRNSPFSGGPRNFHSRPQPPVDAVIGIDFGTRFTKVAIGIGPNRYIWEDDARRRLIPTMVYASADGRIGSYPQRATAGQEKIEYIKMLLADPKNEVFKSIRSQVSGRPMQEVIQPIAALFLSNVIRHVKASTLHKRPELAGRTVNWYLNIGVPVSHCDADIQTYRQVAAASFAWANQNIAHLKLDALRTLYARTLDQLDVENSPASVVPELTAALHEFVRDPNRADNLYGFLDVGGGTLDGAIFHINRTSTGKPLQIHAARVDHCGTMALSRAMLLEIYSNIPSYIESQLISANSSPSITIPLNTPLGFRDNNSARDQI